MSQGAFIDSLTLDQRSRTKSDRDQIGLPEPRQLGSSFQYGGDNGNVYGGPNRNVNVADRFDTMMNDTQDYFSALNTTNMLNQSTWGQPINYQMLYDNSGAYLNHLSGISGGRNTAAYQGDLGVSTLQQMGAGNVEGWTPEDKTPRDANGDPISQLPPPPPPPGGVDDPTDLNGTMPPPPGNTTNNTTNNYGGGIQGVQDIYGQLNNGGYAGYNNGGGFSGGGSGGDWTPPSQNTGLNAAANMPPPPYQGQQQQNRGGNTNNGGQQGVQGPNDHTIHIEVEGVGGQGGMGQSPPYPPNTFGMNTFGGYGYNQDHQYMPPPPTYY